MTGHSTFDALVDAMESGATDYLLKPLNQKELIEIIKDARNRQRRWQEALAGTMAARQVESPAES